MRSNVFETMAQNASTLIARILGIAAHNSETTVSDQVPISGSIDRAATANSCCASEDAKKIDVCKVRQSYHYLAPLALGPTHPMSPCSIQLSNQPTSAPSTRTTSRPSVR